MVQFSFSFFISMLHSLWQSALMLSIYFVIDFLYQKKITANQKKHLLFFILITQFALWVTTFSFYYFKVQDIFSNPFIQNFFLMGYRFNNLNFVSNFCFILYVLILVYKILNIIFSWIRFKNNFKQGLLKPSVELKLFTSIKSNDFGIKRKITIWLSYNIPEPITFGFFKPIIVLPFAVVNQLSLQQTEMLIIHELTHIKVNDYFFNWAIILVETIFFFNPFILQACKNLKLEREKYCDSKVVQFNYPPLLYAEALLKAYQVKNALNQKFKNSFLLGAISKNQDLLNRIHFFTNNKNSILFKPNRYLQFIYCSIFLMLFFAAGYFQFNLLKNNIPTVKKNFISEKNTVSEINFTAINTSILSNTKSKIKNDISPKKAKPKIAKTKNLNKQFIQTDVSDDNNITFTPIGFYENDATKQITISEEQLGTKNKEIKTYTLSFENGKWTLKRIWEISAKEIKVIDSTKHNKFDSTIVNNQVLENAY